MPAYLRLTATLSGARTMKSREWVQQGNGGGGLGGGGAVANNEAWTLLKFPPCHILNLDRGIDSFEGQGEPALPL